jgi:hypothetical protein
MDRDDFIITVYCLVCICCPIIVKRYRLRRGGFAPALTDEEVITMESAANTSSVAMTRTFMPTFGHITDISFRG